MGAPAFFLAYAAAAAVPYPVASTAPLKAAEYVVAEDPARLALHVEFDGAKGFRVPAFLYMPKGIPGPLPAILHQYGSGGSKRSKYIVLIAQRFVAAGFAVLTIDAPGRGERRPAKKKRVRWVFGNSGRERFLQTCGDYSRAVDYLSGRPEVDPGRMGFVGTSWGAVTGIVFAAHDPRVRALASLVGGGGFLRWAGALAPANWSRAGLTLPSIDPVDHVGLFAPRPLLLLNVRRDWLVPSPFAVALHRAAGPGKEVVWVDTDHIFSTVDREAVADRVAAFMARGLAARPPG